MYSKRKRKQTVNKRYRLKKLKQDSCAEARRRMNRVMQKAWLDFIRPGF